MRKLFLFFIVLLSTSAAAQHISVKGVVYDNNKKPLSNVAVSVANSTSGIYTNRKGEYQLDFIKSDSVKILFWMLGYQKTQIVITDPVKDIELNVMMLEKVTELETVVVEGKKRRIDAFERVNVDGVSLLPSASGGGIETILSTYAGVSSTNELSSQYSVRGGNFDENMVYVNDVEIYRPLLVRTGQQEGLSFINPDMVESVSFSTGGFNAQYKDKMSSVLDIRYKKPKPFEARVGASFLGGNVYVGSSTGRFSQITGIRYKTNRSLLKTTDTDAEYDPTYIDAQTHLTYDISPKWEVSFLGNYAHNTYEFTPKSRETTYGTLNNIKQFNVYFKGWEKDRFINYHAALTLKGKITDNLTLGVRGMTFSSNEREKYDIEGEYWLRDSEQNENIQGIGNYMEHARNKLVADVYKFSHFGILNHGNNQLKWGIDASKEKINDKVKEWEMRDSVGYSIPNTGQIVSIYSNLKGNNKLNSSRYSGYVQDNMIFESSVGLFILNAGVRASYWDFNKEFLLSPRASLAFVPSASDNLTVRFSTGMYYQSPFYKEVQQITSIAGNNVIQLNDDIKSQKSIHFVLGGDYYFNVNNLRFKLTSEAYYKKLSDINPYTVNNVKIRYAGDNIGDGYIMGLDTKLYGEFIPGTDSWISFSLMKTEQNIYGSKVPLPTDQRYNLSAYFQDYMPGYERLRMSVTGLFSQGMPTTAPHKGLQAGYFRTSAYKRVDLGLSWQALGEDFAIRKKSPFFGSFKNIWLGIDIFNLFDMENVNTYYWIADVHNAQHAVPNYMTGRQIIAKVVADF